MTHVDLSSFGGTGWLPGKLEVLPGAGGPAARSVPELGRFGPPVPGNGLVAGHLAGSGWPGSGCCPGLGRRDLGADDEV